MKFSAQEDVKLPQADVFARLSDFETFDRIAIKRNVRVSQISQNNTTSPSENNEFKRNFNSIRQSGVRISL